VTSPVSLPPFDSTQNIPFLLVPMQYFFIFQTIGATDLLQPSSTPHCKTFKVLMICFPKCPNSSTIRICVQNVAFH